MPAIDCRVGTSEFKEPRKFGGNSQATNQVQQCSSTHCFFLVVVQINCQLRAPYVLRKLSMIPEIGTGTHLGMKAKDRKDGIREQRNADAEEHAAARKLTIFMRKTLCTKRTRRKEARIADQKHPLSSLPFAIGAQDDSTPYLYYTADIADIEDSSRGNQKSEVRSPLSLSIRESDKSSTHRPI